jgi:hypothetical protein
VEDHQLMREDLQASHIDYRDAFGASKLSASFKTSFHTSTHLTASTEAV